MRNNSHARDTKLNLKFAVTPNLTDEYALSYVRQDGKKGNPPYTGTLASIQPRFWDWPYWDKESLYFSSTSEFGLHTIKTRLYADTYGNALNAYDDATYTSQNRRYAFRSFYDDFTKGASLELHSSLSDSNLLKSSVHWKSDTHRERNFGEPWRKFEDYTVAFAIEDSHSIRDDLMLVAGISWNERASESAQDYDSKTGNISDFPSVKNDGTNAQAGLFWEASDALTVHGSVAQKNRFATVKDRYSYRLGTALPNPGLNTESALHYEIGLEHHLYDSWHLSGAVFYSAIKDLIQSVRIAPNACTSAPCSQLQNVGKALSQGVELSIQGQAAAFNWGANYTYLNRENKSDPTVRLTDTPAHSAFAYGTLRVNEELALTLSIEGASKRINSTDGLQRSAGYALADFKAAYTFTNGLSLEAGLHNFSDRLYQIAEGFPEAGRTAFLQFNIPFNH